MKVGVVVDNELNNDIRVMREIEILKGYGYDIFVLCLGFDRKIYSHVDGIFISRQYIGKWIKNFLFFMLNSVPIYEWFWAAWIREFITEKSPDILHVHDLYMAKASYIGIKRSGKDLPMILDLHENYPFTVTTYNWTKGFIRNFISRPEQWKNKEKEYLGYADKIIVLSKDFMDLLINRYRELSEENFTVLPNVPDLPHKELKSMAKIRNLFKQSYPVVLYYGVIAERRGVFDALNVLIRLVEDNYSVNFLFIGPVDKKDKMLFLDMINLDSLRDRVEYIPWIESSELPAYLEITDICIAPFHKNPQHESGVANKIYEYMLGGKPVVASNCKPQQDLIERHSCGLIFENMQDFREAIIKLLENKDLRVQLGKNGHNAILNEYNTGMVKVRLEQLYKTLVKNA